MRVNSTPGNFVDLDRLRGIAAVLVLIDHAGCLLLGRDLVPRNLLAVQFFFMLSGFVVACGYEARMLSGMSARGFILRRAIRLYPLLLLGAAFGTGALLVTDPAFAADPQAMLSVLMAILCLPIMQETAFGFGRFPINPPEWSLFFEIAANLGFAMLLPLIRKQILVLVAIGTSATYAVVTIAYWPGSLPFWCEGIGATGAFSTGIVLWRLHCQARKPRRTLGRWSLAILSVILAAICMAPPSLGPVVTPLATLVIFPAIILAVAANGRSPGGSTALGALSYPLYILHWPILLLAREWIMPLIGAPLTVPVACAVACCCAGAALTTFDIPVRTRLARALLAPGLPLRSPGHPSRTGIAPQRV